MNAFAWVSFRGLVNEMDAEGFFPFLTFDALLHPTNLRCTKLKAETSKGGGTQAADQSIRDGHTFKK